MTTIQLIAIAALSIGLAGVAVVIAALVHHRRNTCWTQCHKCGVHFNSWGDVCSYPDHGWVRPDLGTCGMCSEAQIK